MIFARCQDAAPAAPGLDRRAVPGPCRLGGRDRIGIKPVWDSLDTTPLPTGRETNMQRRQAAWAALLAAGSFFALAPAAARAQPGEPFRPPAVPLVTHDPYFSVWSMRDRLTDDWPRHWTGAIHALCGLVRIDGQPYRFLGPGQVKAPPMKQ